MSCRSDGIDRTVTSAVCRMQIQGKEEAHSEAVQRAVEATNHWMERFDVVVIGPGLGRDKLVHETVIQVQTCARAKVHFCRALAVILLLLKKSRSNSEIERCIR